MAFDGLFAELRFSLSLCVGESMVGGCSEHPKEVKGLVYIHFGG